MKKNLLILSVLLGLHLSTKAFVTTVQGTSGSGSSIHCWAGDPYWPGGSNNVCCCDIYCADSQGNSILGGLTSCVNYVAAFAINPPTPVFTYYEVDAEISFKIIHPLSLLEIETYNRFKANGGFYLASDKSFTDLNGNTTIMKAGDYTITNGKLQCFVKRVD